jgi:hypothetical protein
MAANRRLGAMTVIELLRDSLVYWTSNSNGYRAAEIGSKEEATTLAALHWCGERMEPFRTLAIESCDAQKNVIYCDAEAHL